jgi:hypothetical protein
MLTDDTVAMSSATMKLVGTSTISTVSPCFHLADEVRGELALERVEKIRGRVAGLDRKDADSTARRPASAFGRAAVEVDVLPLAAAAQSRSL